MKKVELKIQVEGFQAGSEEAIEYGLIAGLVAEGVVEALEFVDVGQKQSQRRLALRGPFALLAEAPGAVDALERRRHAVRPRDGRPRWKLVSRRRPK